MSDKGFNEKHKEKVNLIEKCDKCQKPVTPESRVGSFTSFLFAVNRCNCNNPVKLEVITGTSGAKPTIASPPQSTYTGDKPDLGERYEILDLIGQGGMGAVWKVRDKAIDKTLAIKVLRKELANDRFAVKRFEQEALAASCLTQVNLVAVYGSGKAKDNSPYLIMDFLEGESLADLLHREVYLPVPEVLDISTQICEALAHAHAKGIIHRDLKPSNIMLTKSPDGNVIVKIVDFGIAKLMPSINEQTNNLTQTGDLIGSPLYMSPEQCKGETVDARSDIYSLGCIMHEMLTGKAAFAADNPIKIILKHLNDVPEVVKVAGLSEAMAGVIERCLEKEPESRFQSIGEVQNGLLPESSKISYLASTNDKRLFAKVIDSAVLSAISLIVLCMLLAFVDLVFPSQNLVQRLFWGDLVMVLPEFALGALLYFLLDSICLLASVMGVALMATITYPALHHAVVGVKNTPIAGEYTAIILTNLAQCLALSMLPIIMIVVSWLYDAIAESSSQQGTLGKRILKLKVVSLTGKPLTFWQASIRHFSRILVLFQLPLVSIVSLLKIVRCNIQNDKLNALLKAPMIHDYIAKAQVRRK
jgi:serine/threonine protein kinase